MKIIYTIFFFACSLSLSAQEILTIGEVFDFEIGDEFQYSSDYGSVPTDISHLAILDKYYSIGMDTVFYRINRNKSTKTGDEYINYTHDTILNYYTGLEESILSYKPELAYEYIINHWSAETEFEYDTVIEYNTEYLNKLTCGIHYNTIPDGMGYYEDCIWGKGIGLIWNIADTEEDPISLIKNIKLIYFKKSGEEYGTRDLTGIADKESVSHYFNIYPNPSSGLVTIESPASNPGPFSVKIFDLTGKLRMEEINTGSFKMDISDLPAGLYLINIEGYTTKLVVK